MSPPSLVTLKYCASSGDTTAAIPSAFEIACTRGSLLLKTGSAITATVLVDVLRVSRRINANTDAEGSKATS